MLYFTLVHWVDSRELSIVGFFPGLFFSCFLQCRCLWRCSGNGQNSFIFSLEACLNNNNNNNNNNYNIYVYE